MQIESTRRMRRRWELPWIWFLGGAAILCFGLYLPAVMNTAYETGLIGSSRLGGISVLMTEGWFPAFNSQSGIGRVLGDDERPTLVYVKTNGLKPGFSNVLAISIATSSIWERGDFVRSSRLYPWGKVVFMNLVLPDNPDARMAWIPEFSLRVSAKNQMALERALQDIKRIRKEE